MASNPSTGLDLDRPSAEALNGEKSASGADVVSGSHADEVRVENKEAPVSSFDANGEKEGDAVIDGGSEVKGDFFLVGESAGISDSVVEGESVVNDDSVVALEVNDSKETVEGENFVEDGSLVGLEMDGSKETVQGENVVKDAPLVALEMNENKETVEGENVVKDDSLVALEMNESKETGVCEKKENVVSGDSVENKESVATDECADGNQGSVASEMLVEKSEGEDTTIGEKEENVDFSDTVDNKESVANDEFADGNQGLVASEMMVEKSEGEDNTIEEKEENADPGYSVKIKESVAKDESADGNQGLVGSEMMVEKSERKDNTNGEKEGLDKKEIDAMEIDQTIFSYNDLVWGKIRSHPWWPGQIFDPKYASEMALKCQKRDHFLVAYFGDKTFAWCNESQLKPFQENFSKMGKQSIMVPFVNAVTSALAEYSRRVELGFACKCLANETFEYLKHPKVENAGVQEGTFNADVEIPLIMNSFEPKSLLEHILTFAECPYGGVGRLELATVIPQLKAFYRSKGHPELPVNDADVILLEDNAKSHVSHKSSQKDNADGSSPVALDITSGKRSKGRPLKDTVQTKADVGKSGSKVKTVSQASAKKQSVVDSDSGDLGTSKKRRLDKKVDSGGGDTSKKRRLDKKVDSGGGDTSKKRRLDKKVDSGGGDTSKKRRLDKKLDTGGDETPSTRRRPLKIGDHISRVASKLNESRLTLSAETEKKSVTKRKRGGGKATADNSSEAAIKEEVASNSADELLSQLCVLARDPMIGCTAPPLITTFFRDYNDYRSSHYPSPSNSGEGEESAKLVVSKRGRKKKVDSGPAPPKTSDPDYMQDSYWSDIIFHSSPEREPASSDCKRKRGSEKKGKNKKAKLAGEHVLPAHVDTSSDQVDASDPADEQGAKAEGILNNCDEKTKEETPTTLILSFDKPESVPSAAELIRIFSPFGPLKEEETEVLKKTSRGKVVFRYRKDAENAFSSAGKYSAFGSALVSYRLMYSPSPKPSTEMTD